MLDHSTNVFQMVNIPFPIFVIAWAIPSRFSGRACDGSVTVRSEDIKRRFFFVIYTNARHMEKKIEEWVALFMMENEKKS